MDNAIRRSANGPVSVSVIIGTAERATSKHYSTSYPPDEWRPITAVAGASETFGGYVTFRAFGLFCLAISVFSLVASAQTVNFVRRQFSNVPFLYAVADLNNDGREDFVSPCGSGLGGDGSARFVDVRVFVAGETDITDLASFFAVESGLYRSAVGKDAIRIVEANDFVMLHEIDVVGLETFQTSLNLARCDLFGAAVNFRHQKYFLPIAGPLPQPYSTLCLPTRLLWWRKPESH